MPKFAANLSIKDVASRAEIVITILPDGPEVEQAILGPEGAPEVAHSALVLVDMSSSSPAVSQKAGATYSEKGAGFLDAPVSGREPKAKRKFRLKPQIVTMLISTLCMAAALIIFTSPAVTQQTQAPARQTFEERFFAHNNAMTALQPTWPTPLVEPDPRLTQYYRLAFSNQYTPARTQTVNYGNGRGGGIVAWNRIEVDLLPPGYIQHNSSAADGFGDTAALVKLRIASGNAEHGNFIATALLNHTFASSSRNGAATDSWNPTLAGGIGFLRHFDAESSLGGSMPTGKIAAQGRSIAWNSLVQDHVSPHVFLELENNASFYFEGSHDGKMQNFITPAAFYIFKRKEWKPTDPYVVFNAGMQIATSGFHTYNHNLIVEMRVLF